MSVTPREIGTLIVVVLKANHLPNKRHIGKQDPYCLVTHNGEKRRTKAIKRGGQHPEWDEELRFTLYEDQDPATNIDGTPPKDTRGPKKVKGGWTMKIACFADDPREPDLIGEADVDLTEVLTKGETDEWFTLMNKDKFAGKVYLELTFWSNEPPPEKKVVSKPAKSKQYGGPGSFVPSGEDSTSRPPNGASHPYRVVSTSSVYDHTEQTSDNIPSSLRASSSLAKLDLYVPPYERSVDTVANEFRELGVSDDRQREKFSPFHDAHTPRSPSQNGYSTVSSHRSYGYDQNISEISTYGYDSSPGQSHHTRTSGAQYQAPYRPRYESQPSYPSPARGPRHSIPASSSGFMPLSNSSGFTSLPSHSSEPCVLGGHTTMYNASQLNSQPAYGSQTPAPDSYLAPSSSGTFVLAHPFPQSQSYQYTPYPPSTTPVTQTYSATPVQGQLPLVQAPPNQGYQAFVTTPSPSHDAAALPHSSSATSSFSTTSTNSRPLPLQPQVLYTQSTASVLYSAPPSTTSQPPVNSFTSSQPVTAIYSTNSVYQQPPAPPPPPPPPLQYTVGQLHSTTQGTIITPPPPPSSNSPNRRTRRQSSLPQPPVVYQQPPQPVYQPPPPPPLPPTDFTNHPLLPPPPPPLPHIADQSPSYHPGPLPNPPSTVGTQGQWTAQTNYTQPGFQ
ncbi:Ingression protein fic1 [Termitomyces sp. T112]|nr:Ingression protein fic1 [Termitomyces sp. T112]KAH0587359.1 hypothetical protein H2248_006159 [Termitomyces sp. 'cryptogamus']KNZ74442.1 Ingression protein fic1 [Termitomyces sp. J132]